jgi:hypothetical protein
MEIVLHWSCLQDWLIQDKKSLNFSNIHLLWMYDNNMNKFELESNQWNSWKVVRKYKSWRQSLNGIESYELWAILLILLWEYCIRVLYLIFWSNFNLNKTLYTFSYLYMDVTQSNFGEAIKIIEKLLPKVQIYEQRLSSSPLTLSLLDCAMRSSSGIT